jgi:hypothetical protein
MTAVLYVVSLHATLTFVAALNPRAIVRAMLRRIEVRQCRLTLSNPR